MAELEFDIDVVSDFPRRASSAWHKSARQIAVALCGAGILAWAMPVLSQPLALEDDDDDVPTHFHHHHHARTAKSAPFAPNAMHAVNAAIEAPAVIEEPIALVPLQKPKLSERVRRRQVRTMTEKSAFFHVIERAGASEPEIAEKQAVHVNAPSIADAFDASSVNAVMHERTPAFRACYERALKKNATLSGSFSVSFTINTQGSVATATVQPRDGDGLGVCVKGVLKRVHFGKPSAPVDVSRHFTFRTPS